MAHKTLVRSTRSYPESRALGIKLCLWRKKIANGVMWECFRWGGNCFARWVLIKVWILWRLRRLWWDFGGMCVFITMIWVFLMGLSLLESSFMSLRLLPWFLVRAIGFRVYRFIAKVFLWAFITLSFRRSSRGHMTFFIADFCFHWAFSTLSLSYRYSNPFWSWGFTFPYLNLAVYQD